MDRSDLAKEWFCIAEMDLSSAKYLLPMHPQPLEIICFHLQQSAEKFLKGFLLFNGEEIIKTHDLVFLNKLCIEINPDFEFINNDCLNLTDYSVKIRYPYPLEITEDDLKIALHGAERIKNFILKKMEV